METENDFSEFNLDELFNITDTDDSSSTADEDAEVITDVTNTTNTTDTTDNNINLTKAMSDRINEVKKKTQDNVAKQLGFDNYDDLMNHKNKDDLNEVGIDIDDPKVKDMIDKIVNDRISNDERFKKLEEYENKQKNDFLAEQLNEINSIEGTSFTAINQLPQETIDMFGKLGNLKQAYFATQGEKLLAKQLNGTTTHLSNKNMSSSSNKMRHLSEDERNTYRMVMPDITDEQLDKIMKEV